MRTPQFFLVTLATLVITGICQEPPQEVDAKRIQACGAFSKWLGDWSEGVNPLRTNMGPDQEGRRKMQKVFATLAAFGDLAAAKVLFRAATAPIPKVPPEELLRMEPWLVRRTARRLIGNMKGPGVGPWLASLLLGSDPDNETSPVWAALHIVPRLRPPGILPRIQRLAEAGRKGTRLIAVRALGRMLDPKGATLLQKCLKEGRVDLRCTACGALGVLLAPYTDQTKPTKPGLPKLPPNLELSVIRDLGNLLYSDRAWPVRAAACDALLQLRTVKVIPALIRGLTAETKRKDTSRRVALALGRGLQGLTGLKLPLENGQAWKDWWRKEGKDLKVAARGQKSSKGRGAAGTYVRYFNLEVESERLLFIVDASGSMVRKVRLKSKYDDLPAEDIKFELVKKELSKVILALSPKSAVNIIFFNQEVAPFRPMNDGNAGLMLMNEGNKEAILEFLALSTAQGLTNLYGALNLALKFGRGSRGKRSRSRTDPLTFDTIYLLSDGAPTTGEVIDTDQILKLADRANAVKKIVIHTITFGDVNNARFMEQLAKRNGGHHVHID